MPEENGHKHHKVGDAINDLIARVGDLTSREDFDQFMVERLYRIRDEIIDPVRRVLLKHKRRANAQIVMGYYRAVEEYVICFLNEPEKREDRRKKIAALERRVRRALLSKADKQADVEKLLDNIRQWQWKTTIDENGRIAFSTGSGAAVPAQSQILQKVGPQVIEQAVKAQRPYSDDVRPRDLRNEPGGLLVLREAKRLIVVGDLHGRYDNLEHILGDGDNLKSIIDGDAHLVFIGDAIHPRGKRVYEDAAYEESFCVMMLIMTLKAENPGNVHYILGNHDNAHVGGAALSRGKARPDQRFENFFREKLDESVVEGYRKFVRACPVAVRAHAADDQALLIVHATLSGMHIDEETLINIFASGRRNELIEDLLWCRQFDPVWIGRAAACVGAKFVIGGHTIPRERNARAMGFESLVPPAIGKVGDVQLIVDSQCDVAGYLDIDLTRPLPDNVALLKAPDGQSALRIVRPRGKAGEVKPATPEDSAGEEPDEAEVKEDGDAEGEA